MLLVVNAHHDVVDFTLPDIPEQRSVELSDRHECADARGAAEDFDSGDVYQVTGRSLLLFALHARGATQRIFKRLEEALTDEVQGEGE